MFNMSSNSQDTLLISKCPKYNLKYNIFIDETGFYKFWKSSINCDKNYEKFLVSLLPYNMSLIKAISSYILLWLLLDF